MDRNVSKLLRLFPGRPTILSHKKAAWLSTTMPRGVNNFGVSRIDEELIQHQLRTIQICKETPGCPCIARSIDLAVKGTDVKSILVFWVNCNDTHIAAARTHEGPACKLIVVSHHSASGNSRLKP